MNVYEIVTERLLKELESGVVPWHRPWIGGFGINVPIRWAVKKAYRGINTILLPPGQYATMNQISKAGGKVKKGSKAFLSVYWNRIKIKDKEDGGKEKIVPILKYNNVFDVCTQVEGLSPHEFTVKKPPTKSALHHACDVLVKEYEELSGVNVTVVDGGDKASYFPLFDIINVPNIAQFKDVNRYYSTLFHEMAHSTGHPSRLNRIIKGATFGSSYYAHEELVAEITATMLCGYVGIDTDTVYKESASYIASWKSKLQEDKYLVVRASGAAQKAANYILDLPGYGEEDEEHTGD